MPPQSFESFLAALRKSNLLGPDQWRELTESVATGTSAGTTTRTSPRTSSRSPTAEPARTSLPEPAVIAKGLVARGWLTNWQAEHLLAGRHSFFLGRYKLLDQIGSGGMGAVFLAEHAALGRTVALKLLAGELSRDRASLARFQQEIQAVSALDHPNIVTAFDADSVGETHFLVMEYAEGQSLADLLRERGPAPVNWACECVRQVAEGLQHAWERGLVHRDIKPSNLLVSTAVEGEAPLVKILDLGLARVVSERADDAGLTQTGQVLGTPDYISPEQAANTRTADIRSDLFSLGVTFYRMLTGELPFSGTTVMEKLMARATETPGSVRALRPDVPEPVAAIVRKLLARDPSARFQTPRELALAVAPYGQGATLKAWKRRDFEPLADGVRPLPVDGSPSTQVDRLLAQVTTDSPSSQPGKVAPDQRLAARVARADRQKAARRAKTPARAIPIRPVRKWRLLAYGTVLLAVLVGLVVWLSRPPLPRTGRLIVDWPLTERQGGVLLVNGKEVEFGPEPQIVWQGEARAIRVRAVRPGYPPIDTTLTLRAGQSQNWSPNWSDAEADWFAEMRSRIDLQLPRVRLARAEETASIRELMLGVLDRAPGGEPGRQLASDLGRVLWPLDDLLPTELEAAQRALLGWPDAGPVARSLVGLFGDLSWRHGGAVTAVAISIAGDTVVSFGADQSIRVWNPQTGLKAHRGYQAQRVSLAIAPAGDRCLVTGGAAAILLNLADGQILAEWPGVSGDSAFAPSGERLALFDPARGIVLVDSAAPAQRQLLDGSMGPAPRHLAWSSDGTRLAAQTDDDTFVWSLAPTPQRMRVADRLPDSAATTRCQNPIWHPTRPLLAVGLSSNDVALVDFAKSEPQSVLLEEAGDPLAFPPESDSLLSRRNQRVVVWNVSTGAELRTLQDVSGLVAVAGEPARIVTGDEAFGWLRMRTVAGPSDLSISAHVGPVTSLAAHVAGRWVVTGGADGRVRLWNAETGAERGVADAGVSAACLAPDGQQLLLGFDDGSVRVWDVAARQLGRTLVTGAREIRSLSIGPGGRFAAAVGDWGFFRVSCRVWETATGREISLEGDPQTGVRAARFPRGGEQLALATDKGLVSLYSLPTGTLVSQLDLDVSRLTDFAVEPHGERLIALGNAKLFGWSRRDPQRPWSVATAPGLAASLFRPFSPTLLVVTSGGELFGTEWPAQTAPKPPKSLFKWNAVPTAWAVSPAGDRLAIGTSSGAIEQFSLSPAVPSTPAAPPETRSKSESDGDIGNGWPSSGRWSLGRGPIRSLEYGAEGRHLLVVGSGGAAALLRIAPRESTSPSPE
jgi:serine/threonine protein kinase/WD40 repeat protein